MKQCEKGHFYDENRYAACPYCVSAGTPANRTVAVNAAAAPVGKTVAVQETGGSDRGKTVAVMQEEIGLDPAVGFLVCVKGPHRGQDFRLMAGRNALGRGTDADISLPEDATVSREKHAIITYDERNNLFVLSPGIGRGVTYLNNQLVESSRELQAYDKVEIGSTLLVFLPLCGQQFRWTDYPEA